MAKKQIPSNKTRSDDVAVAEDRSEAADGETML